MMNCNNNSSSSSSSSSSAARIQQQNNIGVRHFVTFGNYEAALCHFREALTLARQYDTTTTLEQQQQQSSLPLNTSSRKDSSIISIGNCRGLQHQRCVSPGPFEQAIRIKEDIVEIQQVSPMTMTRREEGQTEDESMIGITEHDTFVPYLYLHPFVLANSDDPNHHHPSSSPLLLLRTVMIILNLGMVYQAMDRSSMKAMTLYQIALSIFNSITVDANDEASFTPLSFLRIEIALHNNYAMWWYENSDRRDEDDDHHNCHANGPMMIQCLLEDLYDVLVVHDHLLDDAVDVRYGLHRNLRHVLKLLPVPP